MCLHPSPKIRLIIDQLNEAKGIRKGPRYFLYYSNTKLLYHTTGWGETTSMPSPHIRQLMLRIDDNRSAAVVVVVVI